MFDLFAKLLSSIASFLFPLFASYKALKTSDPAQLTPWLMYWVVLACALLVESWVGWILCWIPFYAYIRLLFLLYLVLPQSQGARIIYQTHIHPYLQQNENKIDQFIATAHDRVKSASLTYLRQAIELIKTRLLGLPPREAQPPSPNAQASPQTYTQSLLARFSVPSARWAGAGLAPAGAASAGADFYNFLASAVSTAMSPAGVAAATGNVTDSGTLVPANLRGVDKMTFIAAQRERLAAVLTALEREAVALEREDTIRPHTQRTSGATTDSGGAEESERPPSRLSSWSGLSKSRSEVDFEKIEAESGGEEDAHLRQRASVATPSGGSWMPWGGWGSSTPAQSDNTGHSSGVQKEP